MEKHFKNVQSIEFELNLEGNGCVNFDSSEQSFFLRESNLLKGKSYNNILFTKKNFRKNEDGEYEYHVKVSSECLRHNIFKEYMPFHSPTIMQCPNIFYTALTHPAYLLRGYMFTQGGVNTLKRKGPLYITDAEEIGEWRKEIAFDFHTRSGEKESNLGKGDDDTKDTSLYKIETVGNLQYKAKGGIDVSELQFISADPLYDRMAIDVDGGENQKIYLNALEKNCVNFKPEFKYYYLPNSYCGDEWAERGILLNQETTNMMIKYLLENMLNISIQRRNAYLKTNNIILTVNIKNSNSEKITINTLEDIEHLSFDCCVKYVESDLEKIQKNQDMVDILKKQKEEKKQSKKLSKNNNTDKTEE
ncbi:MAG: hypothetical protein II309_03050 [Bacilli bacterium]|nr:hypothetical protein [Bacilli bacterium]